MGYHSIANSSSNIIRWNYNFKVRRCLFARFDNNIIAWLVIAEGVKQRRTSKLNEHFL